MELHQGWQVSFSFPIITTQTCTGCCILCNYFCMHAVCFLSSGRSCSKEETGTGFLMILLSWAISLGESDGTGQFLGLAWFFYHSFNFSHLCLSLSGLFTR